MSDNEVRLISSTGARKGSKLERHDLIPTKPIRLLARHYGVGAEKYTERDEDGNVVVDGADNWRKGYDWRLSFAAMMRHALQFWEGEDIDEETGSPHLIAVMWHACALIEWGDTHPEFDTRLVTVDERAIRGGGERPGAKTQEPSVDSIKLAQIRGVINKANHIHSRLGYVTNTSADRLARAVQGILDS